MAAALTLNVRDNFKALARDLDDLAQRQVPFATALTLTAVARKAAADEQAALGKVFEGPTPFTQRAFAVIPATKASRTAVMFVKDIQAAYLAPYIDGGAQVLGRKAAILTPRDLPVNQYGNIPRGKLAALKGRPGVFVGEVRTKNGQMIGGVWQRVGAASVGGRRRVKAAPSRGGRLQLLVQFTRPAAVTKRFPFFQIAKRAVDRDLSAAWDAALARALRTAR